MLLFWKVFSLKIHLHKCNKMHTILRILIVAYFHCNFFFLRSFSPARRSIASIFSISCIHIRSNPVAPVESCLRTWAHLVQLPGVFFFLFSLIIVKWERKGKKRKKFVSKRFLESEHRLRPRQVQANWCLAHKNAI